MVLHLSDAEVSSLLSMDECIRVLEDLFVLESQGLAENTPTTEFYPPRGFFRLKAGALWASNLVGFKAYGAGRRRLIFVFDMAEGLQGIVDAVALTQVRTGAVSALATRYMASPDASSVGIIGTGKEARTQLEALSRVRKLSYVKAYSRKPENRDAFAAEMSERLNVEVRAVASGEEAIRGADIAVTITSANEPVLFGDWLSEGMHICAVGATTPYRRELDEVAVGRASTVVVEHLPQAEAECGELIYAAMRAKLRWGTVRELKDVVSGAIPGRVRDAEITLFDSIGVGTEDVAVAAYLLEKARKQSIGKTIDL